MGGTTGTGSRSRGNSGRIRSGAEFAAALATVPLPWPPPDAPREGRRAHAHRCFDCGEQFRCPGPDQTGACAPICAPCYWVELGRQLRTYRAVMTALNCKRRKIEKAIGAGAGQKAQAHRRKTVQNGAIIAGLGNVMLLRDARATVQIAANGRARTRSTGNRNAMRPRLSPRDSLT